MSKTMLIDAAHPEETRVVMLAGNAVDDFDFESIAKKQIRGNIYLAKVTRVEPSLQAGFVEYGGNRHGFLAFGEIHPDYYQIPSADREALLAEEARELSDEDADGDDEMVRAKRAALRKYKIQEVIRRRQIMLVQAVKEERGNKGAALTTYLSLAGRYCVLMPNTPRGGGISRKITTVGDRKRLKKVVSELDVPQGMGLIIRTAGAKRTKTEIKRDYEYLLRAWDDIRERTLKSVAPLLIHEEDNLVKRAMRDLYDKDVDVVLVEGEEAYREAKDFVKMLMPSHAKKVQQYKGATPLFARMGVERQLDGIHSPVVQLKSGGYIVINQTEALVAIDVNSGKSTRERSIESTALKTNLEAADEAARQMRLRDLAGLVVIDFIDMDESRNDRAVEKRMKDALRFDRARVQMGKISGFGLLEISRQRRRTGVLEGSSHICPACDGTGRVRSPESASLQALRTIETAVARRRDCEVELRADVATALYILNDKRDHLARLMTDRGLMVRVIADSTLTGGQFAFEVVHEGDEVEEVDFVPVLVKVEDPVDEDEDEDLEEGDAADEGEPAVARAPRDGDETEERGENGRNGRRRRRRRGRRPDEAGAEPGEARAEGEEGEGEDESVAETNGEENGDGPLRDAEGDAGARRRRRRGRRGGRRRREGEATLENGAESAAGDEGEDENTDVAADASPVVDPLAVTPLEPASDEAPEALPVAEAPPKRKRPARRTKAMIAAEEAAAEASSEAVAVEAEAAPTAEVVATETETVETLETVEASVATVEAEPAAAADAGPKRTGWWARNAGKLFGN
jgi:ribonuclease E